MKLEFKTDREQEIRKYSIEIIVDLHGQQYRDGGSISKYTKDLFLTIDHANSSERVVKVLIGNIRKDGSRLCENPVDHYFIKSSEPLNKLELKLTSDGKIENVLNMADVLKKWKYTKIYLDRFFVSGDKSVCATIASWTKEFDTIVNDDKLFLRAVKNDLVYYCLFPGYWMNYGERNKIVVTQFFPFLFGNSKLALTNELNVCETKNGKSVIANGTFNNSESDMPAICRYLDIEESRISDLGVELEAEYNFDNVGLIESIELYMIARLHNSDFSKCFGLTIKKVK